MMRIADYQFGVTGDVKCNLDKIGKAIEQAALQDVKLLIFPECALSGYPPRDLPDAKSVDQTELATAIGELQSKVNLLSTSILVGSIACEDDRYYNRAYLLTPNKALQWYDKRALYGWDEESFTEGTEAGIFKIGNYTFGVRICFEVRFPEYFRELYKAQTDCNIVLFYDVADMDDEARYSMIRSHLLTRAVENVTPIFSICATKPYQTAPTCYIDASGKVLAECERNHEAMLVWDFTKSELDFGEIGRKKISDKLLKAE